MSRLYGVRAWVYDAAFSRDVQDEVNWLLERFGAGCGSLLEPGCGSGRLLAPFARRGLEVAGVDLSAPMLERARRRLADEGLRPARLARADTTNFDLGERFDGAFCAINTFSHLLRVEDAMQHLACMAAHLRPGARYLVQLDLRDPRGPSPAGSTWEVRTARGTIRFSWSARGGADLVTRIETQVSRFEIIGGPAAGRVYEDLHAMRLWSWRDWEALLAGSRFRQVAAWAGDRRGRAPLAPGPGLDGLALTWHELAVT